jgi:lipid II:glycine glycyltransferase (peptidoglycan interpeptide bridge formation enzyme)
MHCGKETSYHHGASSSAHSKIPASYLLQWRAICDAKRRGDRVYNFWGIAPQEPRDTSHEIREGENTRSSKLEARSSKHPFSGVTLFKTGFGGEVMNLAHCMDVPLSSRYYLTRGIEMVRKWHRGF